MSDADPTDDVAPLSEVSRTFLLEVGRRSIARALGVALGDDRTTPPLEPPTETERPAATFVTLRERTGSSGGLRLRGCIGCLEARDPMWKSVEIHARKAAFEDPRFPPVGVDELDRIVVSVSVLTPAAAIASPDEIVVGLDGVILERGPSRAVFLPEVAADQGWDVPELLAQLARKAGLGRDAWRSGALFTFRSIHID